MTISERTYIKVCKILGVKPAKVDSTIEQLPDATLVIVPDKVFTWAKIKKLAVEFGKDQPYETYIYEDLYKLYSAEQLSGKATGSDYRYLFIPKKFNVKSDTVDNQRNANTDKHVPSVLEAICYWYTLREQGEELNFDTTYIRHFDLPEKRFGGWLSVPSSYVYDVGEPNLYGSDAERGSNARLAVGEKLEPLSSSSPLVPSSVPNSPLVSAAEILQKALETEYKRGKVDGLNQAKDIAIKTIDKHFKDYL